MNKICSTTVCTRDAKYTATAACTKCPKGNRLDTHNHCVEHLTALLNVKLVCSVCKSDLRIVGEYREIGATVNSLRIGDKERREVSERLSEACADGYLIMEEFETRLEKVADSIYETDLKALVYDLPSSVPVQKPRVMKPGVYYNANILIPVFIAMIVIVAAIIGICI